MDPKRSERSPDATIRSLAARQHGVVCRRELLAAGLSAMQIRLRMRDGRLHALHRGVYLAGAVAPDLAPAQAALLACGPAAALSHRSAAALWGLLDYPASAHPWVTVGVDRRLARPRIVIRRAPLVACDIRKKHGMPLVSPPRAILDCASLLSDAYELESLVAEGAHRRLARLAELRDQVDRNPGRPGVAALRQVLDLPGGPQRTRSKGERALLRVLRRHGIGDFEANARVAGYEVDFLWRGLDFCVELDGWDAHSSRLAFERDRLKWARLQAAGIEVMPITGRQVKRDEDGVVARLRRALARRTGGVP